MSPVQGGQCHCGTSDCCCMQDKGLSLPLCDTVQCGHLPLCGVHLVKEGVKEGTNILPFQSKVFGPPLNLQLASETGKA